MSEDVKQLTLWDWSPEDCPKQETGDFDLSQYMYLPEENSDADGQEEVSD